MVAKKTKDRLEQRRKDLVGFHEKYDVSFDVRENINKKVEIKCCYY